ncbi:MAG: adenosylcobinamide-GDP ribazoletransferase [Actinobacteria bacterium]|uniref:Adenosylcobinamide-GDP ribazoletransferase n=1 Tax=freshwater metagenome TaxID=449393 RepID=A0A6J6QQ77_9ZZZZ|nr:adenosylcobinamide-GDP ribazoletransferase [Actinomycetota bacterium]
MREGWRLAVGTLTALPVRPTLAVTPVSARDAVLLAPVAVLPLGGLVAATCLLGDALGLPPLLTAFVAIGALATGSRALHWDGLSDVADALTASYDAERSLAVMKSGTSGPAGVVATVVVLGVQVSALSALVGSARGALGAGLLVCLARCALTSCCARGVPGARTDGLGAAYVETVPPLAVVLSWSTAAVLAAVAVGWQGPVAVLLAVVVVAALVRRAEQRFGGVTGDVFGAAIEAALATLLAGVLVLP